MSQSCCYGWFLSGPHTFRRGILVSVFAGSCSEDWTEIGKAHRLQSVYIGTYRHCEKEYVPEQTHKPQVRTQVPRHDFDSCPHA